MSNPNQWPRLVHQSLEESARRQPDKIAVVAGTRRITYGELNRQADALATFLLGQGMAWQDRVVIFTDNCPEAIIAVYGIMKAGGIFVLLNGSVKANKLAYILKDSNAAWIVAEQDKQGVINEALGGSGTTPGRLWIRRGRPAETGARGADWDVEVDSDRVADTVPPHSRRLIDVDLCTLIYTSGSTGEPKGVMSTHGNMVSAAQSIVTYLENRSDDVVLNCLPLSFDYGLYQVIMAFTYGGTVVLEKSFMFIHEILTRVAKERVTGFPIVPTIVAMLLKLQDISKYDLTSLRYMTNTGAALPVEHIQRLRALLPHVRLYSMFGLTECKRVCYLPPEELDRRPGSVGKAMPNCETLVVDDEGNPVAPGQVGELIIRGQNVMQGYWNAPELTARAYRPGRYPGERWLYSGDYFKTDEGGFLYFLGRKGDMIKSRGERISPKEVEDTLCRCPGVAEAAVVGVVDEVLGEAVRAFVVGLPGEQIEAKSVLRFCKDNMENFMVPKHLDVLAALPKSPNGKIDKASLRIMKLGETLV